MSIKRFHWLIFFLAVVIYIETAIQSQGYYHPDEHYQIIEFANLKLGKSTPQELAWEYHQGMRPALQPWICYLIFSVLNVTGVTDPYVLSLTLRLLTAVSALLVIRFLVHAFFPVIKDEYQKIFVVISYLLWFLPFINSRFSSESWSGLMLAPALALLYRNRGGEWKYILAGALLGLSFLFRFQTAVISIGVISWLAIMEREKPANMMLLLLSMFMMVVAGIFTDTWFYGQPVLTSWNYFYINIAKGAASSFGIMDAKNYYQWFLLSSIYPIGILITLSLIITAFKYRGQLLIWAVTPFIVMHFLIPHKELRFLFPIALLLPVLLIQAWQLVRLKNTWVRYALILPFIFLNIMGICINLSKDAGDGRIAITSYLSRQYDNRPYTVMYGPGANPYRPWDFLAEHFYLAPNIRELDIKKYDHQPVEALIIRHSDADKPYYKNIIRDLHMQRKMQGIPAWAIRLLSWYYADKHPDYLLLYTI